jgi:hypothetical protein
MLFVYFIFGVFLLMIGFIGIILLFSYIEEKS